MRRFAATLALMALLAPRLTRGEEVPVYVAPLPPPPKAGDLVWRFDGKDTGGVWLTAQQEVRVGTKILSCQGALDSSLDQNARCEVALAEARGQDKLAAMPWWAWLLLGVGAGAASVLAAQGASK